MTIAEIIEIVSNRLARLAESRALAVQAGDLAAVDAIDAEVVATEVTLAQLQSIA